MANEVKSEIRDVVSAVDVYFTPERRCFSRASSSGDSEKVSKNDKSDRYTPGSSSETVIQMIKKSSSSSRLSDEELSQSTEKPCQNKLLTSNVTSVSSQDSGINLSFHELEHGEYARRSSAERQPFYNEKLKKRTLHRHSENSDSSESDKSSNESVNSTKWICPPKNIWQPTVEAMQEYEMIKNGDKIMICLSGGKDSLTLLHALLQYQSMVLNKGVVFTIAAVIIDPEVSGCDPCVLIPHLKALGVHYIINDDSDLIRNRGE